MKERVLYVDEVKKRHPESVRMILTGHADLEAAIAAINKGNVFRFIQKPWDDDKLKAEIAAALEYHEAISGLRLLGEKGVEAALIKALSRPPYHWVQTDRFLPSPGR